MVKRFGCFGCIVLLLAPFVLTGLWNDWQLRRLQNNLSGLNHPTASRLVARYGEVGNFGNGNHLDFWAVEVRSFSGARSVLKQTYGGLRVPVPNAGDDDFQEVKNGMQPLGWRVLPSPLPKNYGLSAGWSGKWNINHLAGHKNLYAIEILNAGSNYGWATFFDWRGN